MEQKAKQKETAKTQGIKRGNIMKKNQVNELIKWLNEQVKFANVLIEEAKNNKNYGKETHYVGMKDAFVKCLQRLPNAKNGIEGIEGLEGFEGFEA